MSCVVSLRSDTPGRSGRGRNYVPATAVTLSSSHKFTSTVLSFVGAGHRAWLQSLNALVYAGPGLSNQKVQVASFSKGAMRTVTAITIDDNPDTQHRRSDKIGNQILYTATI
jgi:hypothetical protein